MMEDWFGRFTPVVLLLHYSLSCNKIFFYKPLRHNIVRRLVSDDDRP